MFLVSFLENALKKAISRQKRHLPFLAGINFFFNALKKILTKTTFLQCASIDLKVIQSRNCKTIFFFWGGGFL